MFGAEVLGVVRLAEAQGVWTLIEVDRAVVVQGLEFFNHSGGSLEEATAGGRDAEDATCVGPAATDVGAFAGVGRVLGTTARLVAKVPLVGVTSVEVGGTRIVAVKAVVPVVAICPPVARAATPAALAFLAGGGEGEPPAGGVPGGHVLGVEKVLVERHSAGAPPGVAASGVHPVVLGSVRQPVLLNPCGRADVGEEVDVAVGIASVPFASTGARGLASGSHGTR